MVRCSDDTLYTGIAKDVDKRISDHNTSKLWAKYTKARRPVVLVWKKKAKDRNVASKLEYEVKKMPKTKKEEMVNKKRGKNIK